MLLFKVQRGWDADSSFQQGGLNGPGLAPHLGEAQLSTPDVAPRKLPLVSRSGGSEKGEDYGSAPKSGFNLKDKQTRMKLLVGEITREQVGAGYDELIRTIAEGQMLLQWTKEEERSKAAQFCGFKSWEDLEVALNSEDPNDVSKAPQLKYMAEQAMALSIGHLEYRREVWNERSHVEVFDPESAAHDRNAWIATDRLGLEGSLYRYSRSVRSGDRVFCLHFHSKIFPVLEQQLAALQGLRTSYWR